MNTNRTNSNRTRMRACAAALGLAAVCAQGGLVPPLYVGNLAPVKDQYGRTMIGSPGQAGAGSRSRVEIHTSTDGIIRPPSTNGAAHPYNPLLTPDSVGGMGMNAAGTDSGLFAMVFADRPVAGKKIFARAFNAPTLAESSFYADTAITTVPTNGTSLVVVFGAAKPLDSGDADGDGLNNSWEKALGIDDRLTPDYDGDGMSDLHEMLAGTQPDDPGSLLAFRSIRPEEPAVPAGEGEPENKPVRVRWQSVPGKKYQLEYVPMLTVAEGEPPIFVPVGEVLTAEAGEYEIDMLVDVPADVLTGTFRVRLVVE